MADKDQYSVETREATRGGDDYTENHEDFDTEDEVRHFIKTGLRGEEHVHSVLFYAAGTDT